MSRRAKLRVCTGTFIAVLGIGFLFFGDRFLVSPSPSAWKLIRVGQNHSDVVAVLGPAPVGSLELKAFEAWDVVGPFGYRRLELYFDESNRVSWMNERVYWSPLGRSTVARHEP
jgi:hypothetical protein